MTLHELSPRAAHAWLLIPVLAVALVLAGCSGDDSQSSSSDTSQEPAQQQQGQSGQMGQDQSLSSSDVTDEQIQQAARVAMSVQMGTRQDRMQMRKDMKEKYGNPQDMDSTQKAAAQKEMRQRQMELQKKQMKIMRKEAEKEGMNPQTFQQIMRAAQRDSTLQQELQMAMKEQMKKRMQEQMKKKMQQGEGGQN